MTKANSKNGDSDNPKYFSIICSKCKRRTTHIKINKRLICTICETTQKNEQVS